MRQAALPILLLILHATQSQGADKQALAEDVYKNIKLFKGKAAARVIPAMDALTGLLGVECAYCHIAREWDKDDLPAKQTARTMFEMMGYLNQTYFGGENRISCWTCHRGHAKPPAPAADPQEARKAKQLIGLSAADEDRLSEQVFHNLQSLTGERAGQIPVIMAYLSRSLGVDCTHCHVAGQWDKDTPAKTRAREMLGMVDATMKKFFGGSGPLGCPDCHQGNVKPQFMP